MDNHHIVRAWANTCSKPGALDLGTFGAAHRVSDPKYWVSSSNISNLCFGTGESIYNHTIIPAIESATAEVIIVTCFWARSRTLDSLSEALVRLSQRHCSSRRREDDKIRVRICFSSASLLHKIFHTTSLSGRAYGSEQWTKKLGLPPKEQLAGLDLHVKSTFVLPFSVMHPKFVIIDRSKAFLPSCNVSWEDWFEGSVELAGPIVDHFVEFWKAFWADDRDRQSTINTTYSGNKLSAERPLSNLTGLFASTTLDLKDVQAIFLPSPHHRNPRFTFPWQPYPTPPPTPLNSFLLSAFSNAKRDIYLQTPNLTAPPVLSALLAALKRGINVTIVTSERLMILEQLITAGTTTKRCIAKLVKRYRRLIKQPSNAFEIDTESESSTSPGVLSVSFFAPAYQTKDDRREPQQSHVKVTIIDSEITVLGSGNMDRASWYTSQELGVAFISSEFATRVRSQLEEMIRARTRSAI